MEKATGKEIVEAMQKMKSGKATGPSEVSVEMIVAVGEIEVKVMMGLSMYGMVEECLMNGKPVRLCVSLEERVM